MNGMKIDSYIEISEISGVISITLPLYLIIYAVRFLSFLGAFASNLGSGDVLFDIYG